MLAVEGIWASPLPLGKGRINTSHGIIPLPAPAVMELIRRYKIPCYGVPFKGETVTPTGAALLGCLSSGFAPMPLMVIERIGYGTGVKDNPYPNLVRAFYGRLDTAGKEPPRRNIQEDPLASLLAGPVDMLEANIDDLNPEIYGCIMDRPAAGALDVFTPQMKNRPAVLPFVPACRSWAGQYSRETTTLGYRRYSAEVMLPQITRQILGKVIKIVVHSAMPICPSMPIADALPK